MWGVGETSWEKKKRLDLHAMQSNGPHPQVNALSHIGIKARHKWAQTSAHLSRKELEHQENICFTYT